MESLKELLDARAALVTKARAILNTAEKEKRDLNTEERAESTKLDAEIDALTDKIDAKRQDLKRAEKIKAIENEQGGNPQIPPVKPGHTRGNDGAALTLPFGRGGNVTFSPNHSLYPLATPQYDTSFERYLRNGGSAEQLGLQVGKDDKGGYLASMNFVGQLIKFLDDMVFIRQLATVLPPTTLPSVGCLSYDSDPGDADWTPEVTDADISEDDAITYGGRELTPHMLSKLVKASQKMVRASPSVVSFLASRLGYKFGVTEEKSFLTGSGSKQALGVFVASLLGIPTTRDVTASAATSFTGDDLIDTAHNLKDVYLSRSTWIASRAFRTRCRKLKDGNGQYLWQAGLGGSPDTLIERPLRVSEFAPSTFTASQYVAVIGDFSFYYIQDGLNLEIQYLAELFALRNQVGWIGRKETDAMPVLGEAFSRLKLGS